MTEWRRHEVECGRCGARTRADYETTIPTFAFGAGLTAVVGLLAGVYHLSRRKVQRLLKELFDVSVSLGGVSRMERRASAALEPSYEEAKREVELAAVKHTDATSCLRGGSLKSLWTIATSTATFYAILKDGKEETIRPLFGALHGILVSDRASVFGFWQMVHRQICWAHLLRKFKSFSERPGMAGAIGRELLDCVSLVFEYWYGYRQGQLSRDELRSYIDPVRREIERTLERAMTAGIKGLSGACEDLLAHREAMWTFVTQEGVEPTNNHAERELRDFVLWRKRCFGSQSDRGEQFAERLMTVARTARKQGKAVLDFITRSIVAYFERKTPPQLIGAPVAT